MEYREFGQRPDGDLFVSQVGSTVAVASQLIYGGDRFSPQPWSRKLFIREMWIYEKLVSVTEHENRKTARRPLCTEVNVMGFSFNFLLG